MSDVELVIKIPEELYKKQLSSNWNGNIQIHDAIINATPLPKGHGVLGDLDKIKKEMQNYRDDCAKTSKYTRLGFETAIAVVENALPIIKADKSKSEE